MKSESSLKLVIEPKRVVEQKYPATFLYQTLIDEELAPVKWKGGKPPEGRDATAKDLNTQATIRITGNMIEVIW